VHAHHPLRGQVVKVVRETVHPVSKERNWVIELPGEKTQSIPKEWAILIGEGVEEEEPATDQVDVKGLQELAKLVGHLKKEVSRKDETESEQASAKAANHPAGSATAYLGGSTGPEANRTDRHSEHDAGQAGGPTTGAEQ
jgi:hypothetical protein